ncbi:E3 ubiquitin-protein ligase MYCBP2-like isoform X4 [Physella acuta]|uniref:E3 ubiquitin-protein ligase MYCBP2-like isoform X4 n=1 Tax=Physella acuta TaxID=109671 RepID=UPI0027DBDA0B|nr:E3 ubiquitin-protein ligase MYCBP2-like isoform X4 [Physella acuta]
MAMEAVQCFRSQVDLFLKGDNLSRKFHDLFEYKDADASKKKLEKKKTKKKKTKSKDKKQKVEREKSPEVNETQQSVITTHGNSSLFTVYSKVRQAVFTQAIREATRLYHLANTATDSDSDSDEDGEEKGKEQQIKIPKIVGLGLNGVFELVRETRSQYPELCVKALRSLLDMLQGQQPEGMKKEPPDVVENLFSLLMDLAINTEDGDMTKGGLSMSSLACSALISLTIALGDTEKLIRAVSIMLMSRSGLELQDIQVPGILASLQKSVQAILLGKAQLPDWFNNGVKTKCQSQIFKLANAKVGECLVENSAIASDGRFLYILNKYGLYKVGSGYGGTIKGKLESQKRDFPVHKNTFLAFAAGKLLCKWDRGTTPSLCVINRTTLAPENTFGMDGPFVPFPGNSSTHSLLFSDGEHIGYIAPAKEEDSFVIRTFSPVSNPPMSQVNEVPLKLTRKCMDVMGSTPFDFTYEKRTIATGFDEDALVIVSGKEFSLIKTVTGKVLYQGKAVSLGIKQSNQSQSKWAELAITKSPKMNHIALGHDGLHALLVAEDGSVYFVGTARRGEDGDASAGKVRRQPKPTKPKKMVRLESKFVVTASCNSGTSALVTKEGELYMFGKDTNHSDHATGLVTELRDVHVAQVCLGKAHAVVLTTKGQVYTFGINNKGQCGRDFSSHGATKDKWMSHMYGVSKRRSMGDITIDDDDAQSDLSHNITMAEDEEETELDDNLCPPGKHKWVQEVCMICSICKECTGYGVSCVNSGRKDRNPGMPCGCGAGDSGCSECGACRVCAEEKMGINELDERGLLDVMQPSRLKDVLGKKNDKIQLRQAQKLAREKKNREGSNEAEAEVTKLVSLPPAETIIEASSPAVQVAVGLHHTLVLLQNGDVYAFGSNNNGQLGLGDTKIRGRPTKVPLPSPVTMVAAGSHHSVFLLSNGQILTCGDHQKGALGRNGLDESPVKSKNGPWFSIPGPVPGVGAKYGRRATWIGASGDQTMMRIDESLINAHTLSRSNIFASKTCIGLIPRGEDNVGLIKCLMISKTDGNCKRRFYFFRYRSFTGEEQENLSNQAVCLDPVYDVLWGYNPRTQEIRCYNVMIGESQDLRKVDPGYCDIFCPELAVPTRIGCQATRSHCALHILGCLDTLTVANHLKLHVAEESREKTTINKVYSKEDYTVVNRFESHGGGWGYSGHSVEAIRFMCDTDVLLGGFGLFGGRGGYLGRIKLYELGLEGGDNEGDGELIVETEETQFVCGAREKYAMLFDEPVPIQANFWYVAWARISGPSSDCGANGLSTVHTDDSVMFKFKSSRKSNNGTDVNAGQIPQLLYKLPPRDSPTVTRKSDLVDTAHILSTEFSHTVTQHSLDALLKLLEYSWSALHATVPTSSGFKGEQDEVLSDLQRIVFISRACLRLLRTYVADVYPDGAVMKKKTPPESTQLAERVGDARDLLRRILAEDLHVAKFRATLTEHQGMKQYRQMREDVLNECHATFRACFHAFYPTGHLKWWCLCDLLCQMEPIIERRVTSQQNSPNVMGISRLLAAVMEAMCHPAVKLTAIMPINCEPETEAVLRRHSMSIDDNTNAMARVGEMHRYPLLATHMTCRMEEDSLPSGSHVTFKDVLDRLLMIVAIPVRQLLNKETSSFPPTLIANTCALLTTIIGELAATAMGYETDINISSRPMLVTPNRFMRCSNTSQWNTGKGSPDGIAFSVDKPGIVMAGVCVYGGSGTYEYEVEVLKEEEVTEGQKQSAKPESWTSLETVKGTFSQEDCMNDIAEIKFDRPLPLKESQKYAVLLKNNGQRTFHGDSGINKVRCPDGTVFTFTSCVQSSNGTNIIRGQIPQILYYSTPQEGEAQTQSSRHLMELLARRNAIDICGAISHIATDLLHRAQAHGHSIGESLGMSHLFSSLLPLALAYVGPVAVQDPRGAVQVLYLVQEILPAVSGLTRQMVPAPLSASANTSMTSNSFFKVSSALDSSTSSLSSLAAGDATAATTTSQHYAIVESDHPYKPANVVNYRVEFPSVVKWMVIEFDPQCATGQPEDSLQLYIPAYNCQSRSNQGQACKIITTTTSTSDLDPNLTFWPVLKRLYGTTEWPKSAVLLPGHEVIFSLETASDYVKDEKASFYGFKCSIVGYEWSAKPEESILLLERELAYLGGMCCSALMKKDIQLPSATMEEVDEDMEIIEEGARIVFENHSSLLEKGFALSQPPTIYQALEGNLPLCWQSNEHSFLKDFVLCTPGTSGGRLARWLQPDSYLDPKQCEIECNREDLKCSWPTCVTVYTKDQYGQLVNVPNLKMEVRAIPIDQQEMGDDLKKMRKTNSRASEAFDMTFGGHPPPLLDTPYEPVLKEKKDLFHSITMIKAYENYSFEELRLASPAIPRPSENMLVRANKDGTYTANWTPGSVGYYNIIIVIDGVQSGDGFKVEVKEPPQGAPPPALVKKTQPARVRRFVAKYSAGLRVRISPTLQSEQIGVVPPNCMISYVDETTNDDGMWLRLSRASLAEYCIPDDGGNGRLEGWCLQYNQHLGKTLLVPVEVPKPVLPPRNPRHHPAGAAAAGAEMGRRERRFNSQAGGASLFMGLSALNKGPGTYMVIKCGSSGHNIRARPSLKAPPIGMITKGKKIKAVEDTINSDGIWIRLSEESAAKYCHSSLASEAWSLVSGVDKSQYMQHESEFPFGSRGSDPFAFRSLPPQQGFQFAMKAAQFASNFPGFFPPEEAFGKSKSMPASAFNFGGITGFQPKVPLPRFGEPPPSAEEEYPTLGFSLPPPPLTVTNYNDIIDDQDLTLDDAILADRILRSRQRSGSNPNPFMSVPPLPSQHQRSISLRKGSEPCIGRLTLQDNKDIPPELQGVPVNELVKALGESRANGNGPTPQPSPPGSPKTGSREGSPKSVADRARESSAPKEELYKTPPSSPVPSRNIRAPLTKVNSFEKSATPTPPATPSTERSDKVGSTKPQVKLTDRKALDAEDLKSKLSPEVEKTKDTKSDTSGKPETDKGHCHVTFSPVLEKGPGISTLSSTKQPGAAPPKAAEAPDSKQVDTGDKRVVKPDLSVAGKKDSPASASISGPASVSTSSPAAVSSTSGKKDSPAITSSKKDSPVAVVAPTVKSSSTTAIRETPENSTAGVGLSGGLPVGGARSRYKSPPFRNDSSSPAIDVVDIGIVGASGGSGGPALVGASAAAAASGSSRKSGMFTIGTASPKDEQRLSPKTARKDRSRLSRAKRERASSPSLQEITPLQRSRSSSASKILDRRGVTVKEALSPAAAECLRAVFAAFMWHEGIVHDAMACASFLKFHPDLTKEMSKFIKEKKHQSSVEPKRQRHATESSKDKSHRRKDNINESRVRFNLEPQYSDADKDYPDDGRPRSASSRASVSTNMEVPLKSLICETKSDAAVDSIYGYGGAIKKQVERHKSEGGTAKFQEVIATMAASHNKGEKETQLPKTLQHLVHFWEELSESVIVVMNKETVPPSPAMAARIKQHERREKDKDKEKKMKKRKGAKPVPLPIMEGAGVNVIYNLIPAGLGNIAVRAQGLFGEAVVRMFRPPGGGGGDIGAAAAAAAVIGGEDTFCELCQGMFPHPVTYHMRQAHPGCGKHASGKGYNSSGMFGGGWAGNCGEGGIGECSWYLMCERCRDKYIKDRKSNKDKGRKGKKKSSFSSASKQQSFLSPLEAHHILKNNAQFLLELASASGLSLPKHTKTRPLSLPRSDIHLPSVSEIGSDPDPFPPVPFQYLNLHNAGNSDSAFAEDFFVDEERVFVRSGSMSITSHHKSNLPLQRPRLPTEPRHSPLARSGSLGQDTRPFSQLLPVLKHENTRAMLEKQPMTKSAGTSPENEQDTHKKAFHRSVSEYVTENETDENDFIFSRAVSVSSRRRNNSGSVTDGGISLLKHPSAAMTRLISAVEKRNGGRTQQRPVMEFIVQRHDLEGLQLAMKQALRKAMCRVFALQAMNWLLRSVVQQVCLHDLLWFFVDSLVPPTDEEAEGAEEEGEEGKVKVVKKDLEDVPLCDHPLSDIIVAGRAAAQLPETFHNLLQTISDVMMLLPMGSALQQMAVRCYCLQFMQSDHQFLHESHVFSNLSRILSKSEEEPEEGVLDSSMIRRAMSVCDSVSHKVLCLKDLTHMADLKASSRQAMIGSLTDNSTETFWESGDEDRNKMKVLTITCSSKTVPYVVYVHVDNIRDIGNKVSSVTFNAGTSADDLKKIKHVEIDVRHCGWINCQLPTSTNAPARHLTLELKGADQSLRLRQLKILGSIDNEETELEVKKGAAQIQQDNCEAETLKVFRILTSQVFGKLVTSPEDSETEEDKREDKADGDNDLKEHMVSILFSRSKLSHMQKQVCNHIVQGIKKEACKMKEEWAHALLQPAATEEIHGSDVYCFELVSMVVALSGSSVGRKYLAQQQDLIYDLFSLLHTSTPRIQRQITIIFRRVLPWVKPQVLAPILSIPCLPPPDYNIVGESEGDSDFDPDVPGILDVFLACVAKSLNVQMKIKSSGPSKVCTTLTMSQCLEDSAKSARWWMRGKMDTGLAASIMELVKDMAAGKLSEAWAINTKAAIAEAILNMTKLNESHRDPQVCVKTPTLWLALASLCVLDQDHVDRLSSGEWVSSPDHQHGQPRPTCDNHDDSVTPAVILCTDCGNLCAECDRYLHLPRRMRGHQRQVFKEEEEAIKVDLHEGCGRIKLFWIMSLVDSRTFKALVEFREGKASNATVGPGTCRFCGRTSNTGLLAIGNVCSDPDCQEFSKNACTKILPCGHLCGGIAGEDPCLPCLHRCRPADQEQLKQDADDMCMICFTEALSAAPAIRLSCSHLFHLHCTKIILSKRYIGARITFGFSLCPICKTTIDHTALKVLLEPIRALKEDVKRKALMRLEYEGLDKAEAITTPGARFYQDPAGFAMDRYAYYVCFKCNKAYYGGEARCDEAIGGGDDFDPSELVCGACSDVSRAQMCAKHGADFLEYKCRYCCSVAVFFCFGTTHFCNPCHEEFQRVTAIPKKDLPHCPAGPKGLQMEGEECPLHVVHPPTGEEFALGCGVCRNAHTF